MINIEEVLNCPLTSQEIYDMINSCLEEAEDNGFLNQFVFERALVCHEVLLLIEDLDDIMEADFDNILATKQDEVEDANDKTPTKSQPCTKNIDGEDQEEIEDAPDKAPTESTPCTKNIKGEKQDTIEDVGESFDDFEFDDLELDID